MSLKLRILRSLTRLFIIFVSLMRSLFSEKMLIFNRCISGLMSNLIRKSCTVSNAYCLPSPPTNLFFIFFPVKNVRKVHINSVTLYLLTKENTSKYFTLHTFVLAKTMQFNCTERFLHCCSSNSITQCNGLIFF